MRHHVHLLIGESLTEAAMKLPIMAARQGSATVLPFITTLHLLSDDKGKLSLNRINTVSQPIEGIEGDEISTKLFPEQFAPKNNDEQALESYIFQLQQSVITIDNPGDSPNLLLTITVPLWDEQAVGLAISLTRAAYGSRTHCDVDIIALFDDFYPIINPNPNNTEYDMAVRECTIIGIEVGSTEPDPELTLYGIPMGATRQEIADVYGEPFSKTFDDENHLSNMVYQFGTDIHSNQVVMIIFRDKKAVAASYEDFSLVRR